MTANHDLQRRLARYYETEPPLHAPDWVLRSALSTIESTPQRRGVAALRRYPNVSTYSKLAAAAVVVIAVGAFALWQLGPGGPGGPTPAPTPTASATVAPSPTSPRTPAPAPTTYVPGALTQTFTSNLHGVSLMYPEGWVAQPATAPWSQGDPPIVIDPSGDKLLDADFGDHLFLTIASRPLGGTAFDAWLNDYLTTEGCTPRAGATIPGADGVRRSDCPGNTMAIASSGGRGYVFELRASSDNVELRALDTAALLDSILATVQFLPEDAVDE